MEPEWRGRLSRFVRPERVKSVLPEQAARELKVEETAQDGTADVRFVVPSGQYGVWLNLGKDCFPFLNSGKHADGHLLIGSDEVGWQGHIVECKKTVKPEIWEKLEEQLGWSRIRLQIIADLLRIQIRSWTFHVACQEDKLTQTTNPALLKAPVGGVALLPEQRAQQAWVSRRVRTTLFEKDVPLNCIVLDSGGQGTYRL